jgi:hypothetical protein
MPQFHDIFFDFEFLHVKNNMEPISLGAVDQDEEEFYCEFKYDERGMTSWIIDNVLSQLTEEPGRTVSHNVGGRLFTKWVDERRGAAYPRFWAYFGAHDMVCLANLYGGLLELPEEWPRFHMDLQQEWGRLGFPRGVKPKKPKDAHYALVDARWNQKFHKRLEEYAGRFA